MFKAYAIRILSVAATIFLCFVSAKAQGGVPVRVSAYVDAYYVSDSEAGSAKERRFAISGFVEDEVRLNTAQVSVEGEHESVRGRVTLQHGTFRQGSWEGISTSPLIQEAWGGVGLSEGLWLDAGYFLTHIGGESLTPKENFLSSHSLITFVEPIYQAGLRISYGITDNLEAQLHLLNGYAIHEDDNQNKSIGIYLAYSGDSWNASYANVLGNEGVDAAKAFQIYHNFVFSTSFGDAVDFLAQIDLAMRDVDGVAGDPDKTQATMIGAYVSAKFHLSTVFSLAARAEYYGDSDGVFSENLSGLGFTGGLEAKLNEHSFIRGELRYLQLERDVEGLSDEAKLIFIDGDGEPTESRMDIMLGIGVWI